MTDRILSRKMKFQFKEEFTFEHRKEEAAHIRIKYPDRAPVVIEKLPGSNIDDLDKRKFLVPSDLTVGQLVWIIRKRIKLPSEKALHVYVHRTIPSTSITVGEIYEEHKDEDGFLYLFYSGENTFGFLNSTAA